MKDIIERLLDNVQRTLDHDGKNSADLARELTAMGDREYKYNQVYDWLVMRKFNPRAKVVLLLQAWLAINMYSGPASVTNTNLKRHKHKHRKTE
jgi:hypothetical protein